MNSFTAKMLVKTTGNGRISPVWIGSGTSEAQFMTVLWLPQLIVRNTMFLNMNYIVLYLYRHTSYLIITTDKAMKKQLKDLQ